ncbi:MAG: ATP-binding cassette domain-containing protein [Anaerolineales bacterium]|nr:ATP-binding cassette domain-containing protein [Anaerolineales bacterium]
MKYDTDVGIVNVSGVSSLRIGRAGDNDRVLDHPAVSAHHARLDLQSDGSWLVQDLESTHGTFVNNQPVSEQGAAIRLEQDTLWIAPFALRLSTAETPRAPHPAHLRLDLVNLERKAGSRILLDLSGTPLSFRPGEFIAVVGGSGAGKSTLLKALLGMDTIEGRGRQGDVFFNNQLLISGAEAYAFEPLNSIVGYVPQQDDSLHFQLSAAEALDYTARLRFAGDLASSERHERVQSALAAVKLDRPDLQNKPIARLSGGQRKRVNIAMELVAQPRLIFLDEPTSGLDPGLDLEMMAFLREWTLGTPVVDAGAEQSVPAASHRDPKTIVLITHATENVRLCDYIVFMGRVQEAGEERGGKLLYFGPPGETANRFFQQETFSQVYRVVDDPAVAAKYHHQLANDPQWNELLWQRARTPEEIRESQEASSSAPVKKGGAAKADMKKWRAQLGLLSSRAFMLLRRDRGAFLFQIFQGILVALLLWGVSAPGAFTVAGVRDAPTTLFILSIASVWLGILNASKEIVKERRVFGRERRYGLHAVPYVISKFAILGGLGLWQMASLLVVAILRFNPEPVTGALGSGLPGVLKLLLPLEIEWFITLELLLLAGLALGFLISAFSRSIDQATLLMFPAMLIQVLLSGLLFDVGPFAWFAFTHWGLRALGTSLNLPAMFAAAGKAADPVLDKLNFTGGGLSLFGFWGLQLVFILGLLFLTCWRQGWSDKARIPED